MGFDLVRNEEPVTGEPVSSESHETTICLGSDSSCRLQFPPDCNVEPCVSKFTIIIFPFLALVIGVLSVPTSRAVKVPYTLFLLLIGIVIGILGCGVDLGLLSISLNQWVHLNPPTIFFYIFLAPLIFEAAFNTRWHVFKRLLLPILTAAFIIVILQAGLIAAFQKIVVGYDEWTWWAALMFGAMLSATDPISVTATLKSLGASEFLNTLIEGESLVNDGSAFVIWEAFIENTVEEDALSVGEIIVDIFRLSVGGMLMGVAFGIAALVVLGLVYDEFEVETSITVIVAFLGFWTAQAPSKLSGVICNVASGLVISAFGRHLITPAVRGPLAEFWELLSWIANTIVFVHAGVLLSAFTWSCAGAPNTWVDYVLVLGYYLFLQVIRMGLILLFRPLMAIGNKWYTWKEAVVVGFSGLRGAVSLVLALEVAGREGIPQAVSSRIVLWTTGIVALSLLVNGFFIKPLIQYLHLDKAKKSKEDFLHRARAIMVQRSLTILDSLCVETAFKAARWSYVVKHVLPDEWLKEQEHAEDFRSAKEHIMDNFAVSNRMSLEVVRNEEVRKKVHTDFNRRLSLDAQSLATVSPNFTPHVTSYSRPVSQTIPPTPLSRSTLPGRVTQTETPAQLTMARQPSIVPLSLGVAAVGGGAYSMDYTNRRSIDVDRARYRPDGTNAKLSQAGIHREVAQLHEKAMAGQEIHLTEEDREVQRRLLTSVLSQVRAMSNASLVEFSVLHNLEVDVQLALDANDEDRDYDLFAFLDNHGGQKGRFFRRTYLRLVEGKRLKGESAITTAVVVFSILTEILKAEILHSSPIIQLKAEKLYEGAAALLNRLEALNPMASRWVESQFAVYVTASKQDEALHDMKESGIVDDQEYGVIHHELIGVRRKHISSRQSPFLRRASQFPPPPPPRSLVRKHPLFSNLTVIQTKMVEQFGNLVHLKSGQRVESERGSLVLVLSGAIRPLEDIVLPKGFSSQVQKSSSEIDMAVTGHNTSNGVAENVAVKTLPGLTPLGCGATMHWCFHTHSGFCGPAAILSAHNGDSGESFDVAPERIIDTQFCCCEITGKATVFSLPAAQVEILAKQNEHFRMEITRSLTREIVLDSVADQRPYSLSHFVDSMSGGIDVNTVVGRAFRILERLSYMTVVALRAGENATAHVQGPGVLLNGTVRVSIVDTSGLIGAINLLHEELTGPALLPAGGLIIQDVHKSEDITELQTRTGNIDAPAGLTSEIALEAAEAAAGILELAGIEGGNVGSIGGETSVIAHVLIEEITDDDQTAIRRLQRWTRTDLEMDMNGRFGMHRHVELTPFSEM